MPVASSPPQIEPASLELERVAITTVRLTDFRNYAALSLDTGARHVVLAGDNGAGKTNLLEALSLLAPGRGLRRATLSEMARADGAGAFAVAAEVAGAHGTVRIGTGLSAGGGDDDDERGGRIVRIDGAPAKRVEDLVDHVRLLWLTPASDGLFTGPASDRRRFLDRLVVALDPEHSARVASFEKAMRGRNKLLEAPRPDGAWLGAIEAQMAELGLAIAAGRVEAVAHLTSLIERTRDDGGPFPHAEVALAGGLEALIAQGQATLDAELTYRQALYDNRARDAAAGRTLEGPHRSDLIVRHGPKDMPAEQSSTGEQKALLVGLILAQAHLIARLSGRTPVLLLDEITAHLDRHRRAGLFDALDALGGQCFMTGTDRTVFEPLGARATLFEVDHGTVTRRELKP